MCEKAGHIEIQRNLGPKRFPRWTSSSRKVSGHLIEQMTATVLHRQRLFRLMRRRGLKPGRIFCLRNVKAGGRKSKIGLNRLGHTISNLVICLRPKDEGDHRPAHRSQAYPGPLPQRPQSHTQSHSVAYERYNRERPKNKNANGGLFGSLLKSDAI